MSEAQLLEGKNIARKLQLEMMQAVETRVQNGLPRPRVQVIQTTDDPSAKWYIDQQKKTADKLGVDFRLGIGPQDVQTQQELVRQVKYYSDHPDTHGIFISLPLPKGWDSDAVLLEMDPKKDIEGVHPASLGLIVLRKARLIPPTAFAAFQLIESTGVELRGKKAVVVGQSAIVGRPLQLLLGERGVTTIVCNTGTPALDLESLVGVGDIVVGCAGKPGLIRGDWIKPGAVVIDVGTTQVEGKLVGDVEFDAARKRAGWITPVPGGVGPLTVTLLFQNLMRALAWQHAESKAS